MSDIDILKEMVAKKATVSLQSDDHDEKKVILEEPGQSKVTIKKMPQDSEVIVIKGDAFPSLEDIFFNGKKHECKRADFVIVVNTKEQKLILYIELKASTEAETTIIQQFKGTQCVMAYCKEIGRLFWEQKDFLNSYDSRFICFVNTKIPESKQKTRTSKGGIHNHPDKMLKIGYTQNIYFRHLVNDYSGLEDDGVKNNRRSKKKNL